MLSRSSKAERHRKRLMHSKLTIQRKRRNGRVWCRPRRHRYCCIKHTMRQTCIETTSPSTARSGFAWFSSAIPEVIWPAGRDGLPAEVPRCPANPIFGRARPIMGQQPNAAAAASVNPSLTGRVNPSFRTARAPKAAWSASRRLPRFEPSRLSGGWPLPKNAGRTDRTILPIRANCANLADESTPARKSAALTRATPSAAHDAAPHATSTAPCLQAQLKLPSGEALDSLLKVHEILGTELPNGVLDVYEAGGGSISFLPSDVL